MVIIGYFVASILDSVVGTGGMMGSYGVLTMIVMLGLLLPSIAAGARRLHDTDRSGWWLLIAIIPLIGLVLIYFLVLEGTKGDNRFGADPYAGELAHA